MIVWLASFPRSGNTYLRYIACAMTGLECRSAYVETGVPGVLDRPLPVSPADVRDRARTYLCKTHQRVAAASDEPGIYVVRNSDDCLRSLRVQSPYHTLTEENWAAHVQSWSSRSAPTFTMGFEKLITEPRALVSSALDALAIPHDDTVPLMTAAELHALAPRYFLTDEKRRRHAQAEYRSGGYEHPRLHPDRPETRN